VDGGRNFNAEFPSLLDENSAKSTNMASATSVWDNANTTKRKLLKKCVPKKCGGFLETMDKGARNGTNDMTDTLKVVVPAKKSSLQEQERVSATTSNGGRGEQESRAEERTEQDPVQLFGGGRAPAEAHGLEGGARWRVLRASDRAGGEGVQRVDLGQEPMQPEDELQPEAKAGAPSQEQ